MSTLRYRMLSVAAIFTMIPGFGEEIEPHFSLLTDFVYMQRYHVKNQVIVNDTNSVSCATGTCSSQVLTTKQLVQHYEPGGSIFFSYIQDIDTSYEIGALCLAPMDNTVTRHGPGSLSFPFHNASFAKDFYGSDRMTARYSSFFYTIESNFWKTFSANRESFFVLSCLFGLRFAQVQETFSVNSYKTHTHSTYTIGTQNSLVGPQVGIDFQIRPIRGFYWDLLLKAGADLNRVTGKISLKDLNNTEILRNNKRQKGQTGLFAQAAVGAGYQLRDWVNVHVGYQMLFFGGLALAPDQIDKSSSSIGVGAKVSPYTVSANGYVIFHGVYSGLTFTF